MVTDDPEAGFKMVDVALRLNMLDDTDRVIQGLNTPSHDEFRQFSEKVYAFCQLIEKLILKKFDGSVSGFAKELGFNDRFISLLSQFNEALDIETFLRPDVITAPSGFKMVELNVGSPIGGLIYASLPRIAGYSMEYDVLRGWAKFISDRYDIRSKAAFLEDEQYADYVKRLVPVQAKELENFVGVPVEILSVKEIFIRGGKLYSHSDNRPIDFVLPMFSDVELVSNAEDYHVLLEALGMGAVRSIMGPVSRVLASKAIFPYIYEDQIFETFHENERDLIRDIIPYSQFLTDRSVAEVIRDRAQWVIKPSSGFCGKGVIVGREYSDEEWKIEVKKRIGEQSHNKENICQHYVSFETVKANLYAKGRNQVVGDCKVVYGPNQIGSRYLGTYIRGNAYHSSSVVNHYNNAAVGSL